ncbi:phosphatidylserine decarboxylase proenzyme 3-like protein 1 [Echria macrotheca]|uniref:Phosphatidylserine decarboxylase proenzyme 3-like protein 1 n=1 Tax=Echria macrotheca TaxID=438768 RepID=A0AAJ0F9D5_9PEZI|nr:phosphatidylserine decarboxylase proenzyme 3-like protein 1 [Echria macrotheca]
MSTPPIIQALIDMVSMDGLNQAVAAAITAAPDFMAQSDSHEPAITNGEDFVKLATSLLQWVPTENKDDPTKVNATKVLDTICLLYFVLDQKPLLGLQNRVGPDAVGQPLTPFSQWIVDYAAQIGNYMNSPSSLTQESFQTFVNSAKYRTAECIDPTGASFHCFNDFFSRRLAQPRTISNPNSNYTVVYPADSAFDDAWTIDAQGNTTPTDDPHEISSKGFTYTIAQLLDNSQFASSFNNGVWAHSFLDTFNYHRMHSPVSGTVVEARVIQAAAYLDVTVNPTTGKLKGRRKIGNSNITDRPRGGNPTLRDPKVTPQADDYSDYQFLQTRGLVVIDTSTSGQGDIGYVAVLPMGMAQVSSVNLEVSQGQVIKKGDPIAFFLFGGSDIVTVFGPQANVSPTDFQQYAVKPDQDQGYNFYGSTFVVCPTPPAAKNN